MPINTGHILRHKTIRCLHGPHVKNLHLGAFKQINCNFPHRHRCIFWVHSVFGVIEKLLQRVFSIPFLRSCIAIFSKRIPPFGPEPSDDLFRDIRIVLRYSGNLIDVELRVVTGKFTFTRDGIDDLINGFSQDVFIIRENPRLIILREGVNQAVIAQVKIRIGRISVKPRKMSAGVLNIPRQGQFFPARAASHFMPPVKHGRFEPRPLQVTGNNRRVMASSNNNRIVFSIRHNVSSADI